MLSKTEKYILELGQTEAIRTAYNNSVSIYLNPRNTQETRAYIKRTLISLESYIMEIAIIINNILEYMKNNNMTNNINLLARAYALYSIILVQFNEGVFL